VGTFAFEKSSFFVYRKREANLLRTLITVVTVYAIFFVALVIAALLTQNFFLLTCIPFMAKELAHVFRRTYVRLLEKIAL
jgi:hypothetical protein